MPKVVTVTELTQMLCEAITSSGTREVGSTIEPHLLPVTGASSLQPLDRDSSEVSKICLKLAADHLGCGTLPDAASQLIVQRFTPGGSDLQVADLAREVHQALVQARVISQPPAQPIPTLTTEIVNV